MSGMLYLNGTHYISLCLSYDGLTRLFVRSLPLSKSVDIIFCYQVLKHNGLFKLVKIY